MQFENTEPISTWPLLMTEYFYLVTHRGWEFSWNYWIRMSMIDLAHFPGVVWEIRNTW